MIVRTVSAAFLVRDGFTGETLVNGAATRCVLDGRPLFRPVWKRDGYLVLTDLAPGTHTLCIQRSGYMDETVSLETVEGKPVEDTVSLKPGKGYRFPPETVRLTLRLEQGGRACAEPLWLGIKPRTKLRLAQDRMEPGSTEAHLFCEGVAALLPIPGHFLLADGKAPELVFLRSLHDETGTFAPLPTLSHGRGTELIPMQLYHPDETGSVLVLLREPGTLVGFCAGKILEADTRSGAQNIDWKLEV